MPATIRFSDVEQIADPLAPSGDSVAPRLVDRIMNIRCRLSTNDAASLEALRFARRAMLREEWTRGVEEGEPSLEDAVFSAFDISWRVPEEGSERCREKLDEVLRRANQALLEISAAGRG